MLIALYEKPEILANAIRKSLTIIKILFINIDK